MSWRPFEQLRLGKSLHRRVVRRRALTVERLEDRCVPAVLHVGPGEDYELPSQAAAIAQDGDDVQIDAGLYQGDVAIWRAANLTLEGVGGLAHLDANGHDAEGKGIWVIKGDNNTVKNIEFSGATVPDTNGAGIRLEGTGLTVLSSFFHDNEEAILTGVNLASDVVVEDSEFARNGYRGDFGHNIYIGNVRSFTLLGSYMHDAFVGHDVKSRALTNYLLYNRIQDTAEGNSSYEIDLPNGGVSYIIGNVVRKGSLAENSTVITSGEEGASNPVQQLYVINNTVVNDCCPGTFVRALGDVAPVRLVNNIFAGQYALSSTVLRGAPGELTTNLVAVDPGFTDTLGFDYHLTAGSAAIGAGTPPGQAADGTDLTPQRQFVDPTGTEPRPMNGALDIGAYGFVADPITCLPPGHWLEVPNSNLSAVFPVPPPPGATGPRSVMDAWSGAAYDTTRDRLIVWGGGHGDYSGNEVYAFDLATLSWQRLTEPSRDVGGNEASGYYPDGLPRSRHTYNSLQYLGGAVDRFVAFGAAALYPGGSTTTPHVDSFNLDTNQWERTIPDIPDGGSLISSLSAYDSSTGHGWFHAVQGGAFLLEYDPTTNSWIPHGDRFSDVPLDIYYTADVDPIRHKFVAIGNGRVYAWDTNNPGTVSAVLLPTTGDTQILNAQAPGFVYDPVIDRFVAWQGGTDVYTLNMDTLVWTRVRPADDNTVIPTASNNTGTYGRFRYVPSQDVFIGVNRTGENVFIYRFPTDGGGGGAAGAAPRSMGAGDTNQALNHAFLAGIAPSSAGGEVSVVGWNVSSGDTDAANLLDLGTLADRGAVKLGTADGTTAVSNYLYLYTFSVNKRKTAGSALPNNPDAIDQATDFGT
jgi:hypothetical protein